MTDIKLRIYQHFYTRKKHLILGKPSLTIFQDKERFDIEAEYFNNAPRFIVLHCGAKIYFYDLDELINFIEKNEERHVYKSANS